MWTGPTGTNTYLLPGTNAALIDAGVGNPEHLASIAAGLSGRPLALVLLRTIAERQGDEVLLRTVTARLLQLDIEVEDPGP